MHAPGGAAWWRGSCCDRTQMWLANALTISRIPLAVVFWLTYGHAAVSVAVIAAAALSDSLDGAIARWARAHARGPVSTSGEWLDPLADKIFIVVVLATIAVHEHVSLAVVLAVAARELLIIPLGIAYRLTLLHRP